MKRIAILFTFAVLFNFSLSAHAIASVVTKTVGGFAPGLTTVGYTLHDPTTGATVGGRVTTGVVEIGGGGYSAPVTIADGATYTIIWDDGAATPSYSSPDTVQPPAERRVWAYNIDGGATAANILGGLGSLNFGASTAVYVGLNQTTTYYGLGINAAVSRLVQFLIRNSSGNPVSRSVTTNNLPAGGS